MLYVDVDALCKLAHWNILPILPDLINRPWGEIGTVSSLKFRAIRSLRQPDKRLFHTIEAAKCALDCVEKMGHLPEPKPDLLQALSESPQIDSGEAILLALTADDPMGNFLTGDKRALDAVSRIDFADGIVGRILIIEQVLLQCLQKKGRTWLLQNVCPYRHIDKAISMILGSRCDGSLESINEGILSYVHQVTELHNPSLLIKI